ncbi:hypothetical protein CWE09_02235 [Aliidiomarina minuta]|uniref:Uncharacterized protein n=1 Tax=Aliidiomarina minuta TaxID=880057 RepID=A0A432W673_9GAMM|nr:hypothetical protein [Aliidiomarina minuta]RUO25573.1 hypothetical protein CWE09_02235 [Aliidiomarina minuta]
MLRNASILTAKGVLLALSFVVTTPFIIASNAQAQEVELASVNQSSEIQPNASVSLFADPEFRAQRPALERMVRTSINTLEGVQSATGAIASGEGEDALQDVLNEAAGRGLDYVAVVQIANARERWFSTDYRADFNLYNTESGQSTLSWGKTYERQNDFRTFIALLSYDLPIELQREYQQIAQVIHVSGREVQLDFTSESGLERGDVLRVFREGREIKDENDVTFGKLQETTGVLRVLSVHPFYTTAEVLIGGIAIEYGQYAERLDAEQAETYQGEVLTVYDDQVAISIGSSVGVQPGSYYAVYQNVVEFGDNASFREQVGSIIVSDVYEGHATGRFTLSNHRNLSRLMVNEGAIVEEIDAPWSNAFMAGVGSYNLLDSDGQTNGRLSYVMPTHTGIAYRAHLGYGDDGMAGIGIQSSIGYSPNFHAGLDVLYFEGDGAGANMLLSVEPPLSMGPIQPVLEVGYIVGTDHYDGLNINLGLRFSFDLF